MATRSCLGRRAWTSAALLALAVVLLQMTPTGAEDLAIEEFQQHHGVGLADQGCRACRSGNCSHAVGNRSKGVFCGDLVMTLQPCCCSFRNECMTTIFSDSCECFNSEEEEELMTTRFYLFIVLTLIAWVLLIYDKMCGAPYKVMNSSHVLLANSPSAARSIAGSESEDDQEEDERQQQPQQQIQEADDSAQVELTIMASPRAGSSSSAGNTAADAASPPVAAPSPSSSSSSSSAAAAVTTGDRRSVSATLSPPDDSTQSVCVS